MKFVTAHQGTLHVQSSEHSAAGPEAGDLTWDVWTNAGAENQAETPTQSMDANSKSAARCLPARAIHELLFDNDRGQGAPLFPATVLARGSLRAATDHTGERALVWIDPTKMLYPPALAAAGISLRQLYLVRPKPAQLIEAAVDCLRCSRVGVVVAT